MPPSSEAGLKLPNKLRHVRKWTLTRRGMFGRAGASPMIDRSRREFITLLGGYVGA
jgi:hypothetical protein